MIRNSKWVISTALLIAALGATAPACADDGELIGTGLGAAFGGLIGSQIGHGGGNLAATGLGIVGGGLIGNEIGHQIDVDDSHSPNSTGNTSMYSDPPPFDYEYTPNYVAPPAPPPTYVDQDAGTYCRPYSQETRIEGHVQESYGTACLQPDGTWRVVQ